MSTMVLAIVLASIFVLVFACTIYALGQTEFREMKVVLALPVSVLCVLSLLRGTGNAQEKSLHDVILIPYEALVYALIFVVILWLLSRIHLRILKIICNWHDGYVSECAERRRRATASKEKRVAKVEKEKESKEVRS